MGDPVQTKGLSSQDEQRVANSSCVAERLAPNQQQHPTSCDTISRSRSATPTPAISIEPDAGLEWTADMLAVPESEIVTSDTSLAKARGSTTTNSSVVYASDDDSMDGDHVFADDTPDEGGGADSGGGASDSNQPPEQNARTAPPDSDNVSG